MPLLADSDDIFIALGFMYALQAMGIPVPKEEISVMWSLFYASALQSQNMK